MLGQGRCLWIEMRLRKAESSNLSGPMVCDSRGLFAKEDCCHGKAGRQILALWFHERFGKKCELLKVPAF